jgi:hypothetical protein
MESKFGSRRKSPSYKGPLIASAASFLIGGALVGYVFWYNSADGEAEASPPAKSAEATGLPPLPDSPNGVVTATPTPLAEALEEADTPEEAVEVVTRVAEQQGGLEQRLAAAEQRLTSLQIQAESAAGNTQRAEALLIAFATRRFVERGQPLNTYLIDQLRLRFGDDRPNAVNTIIDFSRSDPPIRLDRLLARLDGLGPQLKQTNDGVSWSGFTREMGELLSIRRQTTPSPQPERRLQRARFALEQGRYQGAIDEVRAMPGAERAEAWIADAQKLANAMAALENIELAAVAGQVGEGDRAGNLAPQSGE